MRRFVFIFMVFGAMAFAQESVSTQLQAISVGWAADENNPSLTSANIRAARHKYWVRKALPLLAEAQKSIPAAQAPLVARCLEESCHPADLAKIAAALTSK
jgi:hypothetical protein